MASHLATSAANLAQNSEAAIRARFAKATFVMLRYETEFTPCTGITAVTKQERRSFAEGIMIAPWCPLLTRERPSDDPIENGKVAATGWSFSIGNAISSAVCTVFITTDEWVPILYSRKLLR